MRAAIVSSVTEGDKPLNPRPCSAPAEHVLVNEIDLLPHLDFSLERFLENLDRVNPGVEHMLVSARTGEGVDVFAAWLSALAHRDSEAAG